jgi:beta-galactosidase
MGEKLALAVRQPEDNQKIIVVGWGWFPTLANWTWPGREGKMMEVEVYSRYAAVRLYLNDKLVGEAPTTRGQNYRALFKPEYAPGTLKAVGVEDGKEIGEAKLETVGEAVAIKLTPDRTTLHADGQDLSFVQVEVVDKQGRLQPNADQLITFASDGPGSIAGLGNALLKSEEPFRGKVCHVYQGRALIVIRSSHQTGTTTLKAEAAGLASTDVKIQHQ